MKQLLTISVLFLALNSFAISPKALLKKMQEVYNNSDYKIETSYKLYSGHTSSKVLKSHSEITIHQKGKSYHKKGDWEQVHTTTFSLDILHSSKRLRLTNARSETPFEAASYLFSSDKIELTEEEGFYEMTINYKSNSAGLYSKVLMKINKETLFMTKLTLYYKNTQAILLPDGSSQSTRPKAEMEFSGITINPKEMEHVFKMSNYVDTTAEGIKVKAKFKGYSVQDNRTK